MTQKHWCQTSKSAAETKFRISATSWEVRHEWVKTDLKLFLQSTFFVNPSADLPSLSFRFRLRLRNNLSRPLSQYWARESWTARFDFFLDCEITLLGLGINVFRNAFRLASKLVKTCSKDRYWLTFEKQGNWFSLMFPALASKHGKNLKTHLFPKHIYSQA
jgi:hypothetical protein